MARDPTPSGTAHERLVTDALLLLDYAVGSGAKSADGYAIADDIITTIETTADKLGLLDGKSGGSTGAISASDWAAFDIAYYKLATALAPVTGETLRNTMGRPPRARTFSEVLLGDSPALRFTRCLWYTSLGFAAFVLGANWYLNVKAVNSNTDTYLVSRTILELIMPWMYGGLGACVYLLRSAHTYIYLRTFDVRRKPEYSNRILLGAIAGGAIILFANNVAGDEGTVIQLGSAALGFLAGYNTDLLFNAMERVSSALLPKLGLDTVQKVPPVKPPDFNDVADRIDKAKGPDKSHYKAVMTKMYNLPSSPKRGSKEK